MRLLLRSALTATLAAVVWAAPAFAQLPDEGPMPPLTGASTWLNSKPLSAADLRGKVVVVDFWTYSCVNCLRSLPYVKAWDAKYRSQGLVVIGVHAPEFDFEHDIANVKRAVEKYGITYPVVLDNGMKIWEAFHNEYWPAHYFIDKKGRIRGHHFGEGSYDESEQIIRTLLAEGGGTTAKFGNDTASRVSGTGALAAADAASMQSPETYVGYARGRRFASPEAVQKDAVATYTTPKTLPPNGWAYGGSWRIQRMSAVSSGRRSTITYRFHARDLDLVLGPASAGKRVRFHVTIDGRPPGNDAGTDVDAGGNGVISDHRLYQLIRQDGAVKDRTFVITFDTPGAEAYAFTFG